MTNLTPEQREVFDGLVVGEADEISGNLRQPTTAARRAQAIEVSRARGIDVFTAERNLDDERLQPEQIAVFHDLAHKPPEVTAGLLKDPVIGPAAKNDIAQLSFMERFWLHGEMQFSKGMTLLDVSELSGKAMAGTITDAEEAQLKQLRKKLQAFEERDYGFEHPLAKGVTFVHGAMLENLPIMGHLLWEATDEALMGASTGAVVGAAVSAPTAGTAAPVTASVGAAVGFGAGLKLGSARAAYHLEANLAFDEYRQMRDRETGQLMDKDVARGAAVLVGLVNAGLETVAFERLLRTVPGMDKVMTQFSRGNMRKLLGNSTAKGALKRFGANIAKTGIVEGLTEMGQETFTILGQVAAAEVAEGEYDTPTLQEGLKQVLTSGAKGAAGGGGLAIPGAGTRAYVELRAERVANENYEKLQELSRMAQDTEMAQTLPRDFRNHLLRIRDVHGESTQTLASRENLLQFFQEAGLSEADIQERMPETHRNMVEAELTGEEVLIPFEELGSELALMDNFEEFARDIRVAAEGMTAREAEQAVAEREKVYQEYAELSAREDAYEMAPERVREDVRVMLEEAGVAPQVAEHQAQLHGEFWKRAGERFGRDPFEMYKSYAGLSIARSMIEIQDGAGFDRSDAIIGRLREGTWPTQQEMFGQTLTEWLRKSGGLRDEGGELSARDLGGREGLIRYGDKAMTLEEATERAIEAGFLPEEAWQDSTKGDLLDLIDKDLRGEYVYRLGEGDTRMQDVFYEMEQLEQILDAMDIDIQEMTNEEVRAAIKEASLFQGVNTNEGNYEKLPKKTRAIVDEALEHTDEADRIRAQLIELADTPWAYQAIAGAKARVAILRLLEGKEPGFKSTLDAPQAQKLRTALKNHGLDALRAYLGAKSLIGHPGKPVNAVNSSFLNCEPSRNCAKYCYATGGRYMYAVNINKGELASIFVERFPQEAAEMVASDYKAMPEYHADKALRLFDKGDGSMKWLPFVEELNRRGVRAHIFSKRPEFLRRVPDGNVRLLSIDQTNLEMADENPDLQVAMVYEGTDEEITWMNAHAEQIQVILPIMGEKGAAAAERKQAAVAKIPKQLRKNKCPIDAEVKTIASGNVKWDCTRCDKGGGVGCYNAQTTKQSKSLTVPFPQMVEKAERAGIVTELEEFYDGLTGRERELLSEELAELLSQARRRIDAETATDQQGESGGSVERAETAAGALRSHGARAVKKLYQAAYHGTGITDIDQFLTKFIGTGEGSQAFGWGLYFAEALGVAEYYRSMVGDVTPSAVAQRVIDKSINDALEEMSLEFSDKDYPGVPGGVTRAGFIMADEIAEAVAQVGGTKAAVIAELTSRKEKQLEEWEVKGPIYGDTQTYDTAIAALERGLITVDHLTQMEKAFEAEGQVYQVELLPPDDAWLLWDEVVPPEKFDMMIAHAEAIGANELRDNLRRAKRDAPRATTSFAAPLWTGQSIHGLLELHGFHKKEASDFLVGAGIPGNKFLDYDSRWGKKDKPTYNYVVFRDKDIVITDRLYQQQGRAPRGYITMDETKAWMKITLTERADLSTFLHETGHFFLEMTRRLAESPDAPTDLKNDLATIYEWLEVPYGEPLPREAHEKFARGFEQYLMNGQAPSTALMEAFASFKQWLKRIYQKLTALNVEMTPEVRGVMDRMLASEEAIAEARHQMDIRPLFESAEKAQMTAEQFHEYHRLMDKAVRGAMDDLELKALNEYKRIFTAEYRQLRDAVQAEVEAEIAQDPVQVAKYLMRTGKMLDGSEVPDDMKGLKLSTEGLMNMYPHRKVLQRLMGLHKKGGMNVDLAAGLFGFETGDDFVQAILKSPKRTELVKARTEQRMRTRYGDMLNDGTMEAEAIRSMHSDSVSNFLLAELKALSARAKVQGLTPLRVIKQAAQARVANMQVKDLTPGRYRQAEARESRKAIEAAAKGDFVAAHEAKRKQLLNHWLSRYITEARQEVAKQRDYLKRFDTRKVRERMGRAGRQAYLDAIDNYLNGIELRKVPIKALQARQSLAEFLAAREEADEAVQIPDRLRHEANLKNFKAMTVTEFAEIHDAVKNIEHLANLKNKLLTLKERREFAAQRDALVEQIYATQKKRPAEREQNRRLFKRIWHRVKRFHAELLKPEFIARWIDGEVAGKAHEMIFQPFVDAQINKLDMEREIGQRLQGIFKKMSREQKAKMHQRFDIFGVNTTGQEVIAIALNMGNAGNIRKLLQGDPRGWTQETLMARLNEILTLEDWQMVQDIWDTVNSLWPAIAALNERMTGLPPPKVEAQAFEVQGQRFEGGYYPVIYDPVKSPKAAQHKEAKDFKGLLQNNFMRPDVSKGFTEARTDYVGPLLLSLDVLPAHLIEVIHYLTHYEAVTQVNKLMSNRDVQTALIATFGEEVQQQFRPWLQAIANNATWCPTPPPPSTSSCATPDTGCRWLPWGSSSPRP